MSISYTSASTLQYTDIDDTALRDLGTHTWGMVFRYDEAVHDLIPRLWSITNAGNNNGNNLQFHDGSVFTGQPIRWLQNYSGANLEVRATITLTVGSWYTLFGVADGTSSAPLMFIAEDNADLAAVSYGVQTTPTGTVTAVTGAGLRICGNRFNNQDAQAARASVQQLAFWSDAKTLAQCKALRWAPFSKWRQSTSLANIWLPSPGSAVNFGESVQPSDTGSPTQGSNSAISLPFVERSVMPYEVAAASGNPWHHYAQEAAAA